MSTNDSIQRSIRPIPDHQHVGLTTFDAKHPDTKTADNEFSGQVNWIQIDLEKDDHDHLIIPEERFNIAIVRQ